MMKPVPPCEFVSLEHSVVPQFTYPDCELASQVQNNIFWRSPSAELASELDTKDLGCLEFPRRIYQGVHCVCATHTDSNRSQTTGVRRVAVCSQNHYTRCTVVFQHGLVDDTRARWPKLNSIFLRR